MAQPWPWPIPLECPSPAQWAKQRVMAPVRGSPQLCPGCPWGAGPLTLALVGRPSPVLGVFGEQDHPPAAPALTCSPGRACSGSGRRSTS